MEMVSEFETNIQMYRQQIEQLENYLNTLDQPNALSIKGACFLHGKGRIRANKKINDNNSHLYLFN